MDDFSQCVSHNNTIKNDTVKKKKRMTQYFILFHLANLTVGLLRHGCKMAIEPPGIMSSFQVGRKRKGQRIKGFFLERCASYPGKSSLKTCPNTSLNCFTWPPLAIRVAGKIEYVFYFQLLSRRTQGEKIMKGMWAANPQCLLCPLPPYFHPVAIKRLC